MLTALIHQAEEASAAERTVWVGRLSERRAEPAREAWEKELSTS